MTARKTTTPALRRLLQGGLLALTLAAASGALAAPAFADEWRHDRGDVRGHEWREHEDRDARRDADHGYRWYAPGYAYNYGYVAPDYVPAPNYSTPVPFFNFGFDFR
jgi:hypothetical protein